MPFNFLLMLKKAALAVVVAGVSAVLSGWAESGDIANAFREIPYVGALLFGAFLAGVTALRNFLKVKFGWPL